MVEVCTPTEPRANGEAALVGARPAREAEAAVAITMTVAEFRRVRNAFAKSDAVLRRLDHVRSHPLSGAAREARSEIGAAVAHLDRALPPVAVEVVTGITAEGREPTANGEAAPAGARRAREATTPREVAND